MPAVIPAIAGLAASSMLTASVVTAIGVTSAIGVMATSVAIGAVAGAAVGGLQAAVTGGDIGKNMLYGAVGGAVGGAIGGAYNLGWFSSIGISGPGAGEGGSLLGGTEVAKDAAVASGSPFGVTPSITTNDAGMFTGAELKVGEAAGLNMSPTAAGGLLGGDMSQYALVTGGMKAFEGLMSKPPGETYANSEEGINAVLAQRQREAELAANTAQKNLSEGARQSDATRNLNMYAIQKPYDEAELTRNRMRETATGLTLVKKQDVAAVKNQSDIDKELANYTKVA